MRIIQRNAWMIVLLVGTGTATEALADQPAGETAALTEITVTAQRRTENVQNTALGIDVLTPDALSQIGATRVTDLAALVPALQIGEFGNGQQSIFLRGVGTFTAQSYTDPAVSFNVDGVSVGRSSSMTGVMYDLERVEVLKGPQGTLYGRNATGGAINVLPNQPKLGQFEATVSAVAGNYDSFNPEAAVNLPIGEHSAMRMAATYQTHSGYQTDDTGDAKNFAGRWQYLFQPGDALKLRFSADYAHDGSRDGAGALFGTMSPFTGVVTAAPFGRDVGFSDPRMASVYAGQYSFLSGRNFEPIDRRAYRDNTFWGVNGQADYTTSVGTLTVLPAYRRSDLDSQTTMLGFGTYAKETDTQSSIEARFASADEGFARWLLGAYYFNENIDAVYQFDQQALAPIQDLAAGTRSTAAFGRITIVPADHLRLSAGGRYTRDDKSFDGSSKILLDACTVANPLPNCPGAPLIPFATSMAQLFQSLALVPIYPGALYASTLPGAQNSVFPLVTVPIDQQRTYTKWTWHAGVEYDLAPESLLYASYDTGYHAGGFAFAQIKPSYDPETLTSYSVGSKNRFLGNTLQLNVEMFYWLYRNQQIPHGATDITGAYVFLTDNAGASTNKGFEVSLKYLATKSTALDLDAQYLNARYDRFTYRTPAGGTNTPPVTGCPFARTDSTHYTVDCAGRTTLQSPRWTLNAGIQQTMALQAFSLTAEATAHYQTDSIIGFEMLPIETQGSYVTVNAALTLAPNQGRWSIMAFGNNLGDRRPGGAVYYNSVDNVFAGSVGPPRTFGVRLSKQF